MKSRRGGHLLLLEYRKIDYQNIVDGAGKEKWSWCFILEAVLAEKGE